MQTRYGPHRGRAVGRVQKGRQKEGLIHLRMGVAVALLLCVAVLRGFFPGATTAMQATVLPMIETDMDYRAAIATIGATLAGDSDILEVLGEITSVFSVRQTEEETEPSEAPKETIEPKPPVHQVIHPPLEEIFPVPEMPLLSVEEPVESPEALAVFLAHQEAFASHDLPVNASLDYYELPFSFVVPVAGWISSPFGFRRHPILEAVRFHFGTDIAANTGTPFVAFAAGRVVAARECESWGKYILLYHGAGTYTRYAHADVLYVQFGDEVEKGQLIGRVGATGAVTGPHLHFELRVNEMYRNPEFYVEFTY